MPKGALLPGRIGLDRYLLEPWEKSAFPNMLNQDIADFLVRSRQCEIEGLEHLLTTSIMVGRIRALIHGLQRERGATNLFLGSRGKCYAERMVEYRSEACVAESDVRVHLVGWLGRPRCHTAASRFYAHVALVLHGLGELPRLREKVDRFEISAPEAMESFNDLVRHLLAVVFEAADPVSDPAISSALVALLNFMQGKELAGQERAVGVAGFGLGWREEGVRQALLHRIDAQERCFQIFSEFADAAALVRWQQLSASPLTAEVERLRRMACTRTVDGDSGFELAQIWFDQTTRRIDAMKSIEDDLERALHDLCETRLAKAHAELIDDEARIAELARQCSASLPVGVILGRPVDSADPGLLLDVERRHVTGGTSAIGQSLLELVQMQSRRLQTMEDELQAAREALDERKLIEQAKALLIKHRGMTEDEAYRVLRKAAMDQGKRLIEVARAAIAMAEVLGSKF